MEYLDLKEDIVSQSVPLGGYLIVDGLFPLLLVEFVDPKGGIPHNIHRLVPGGRHLRLNLKQVD